MQGSPIPHARNPEGVHQEDETVVPVPFQLQRVVDPHPETGGDAGFVEDVGVFEVDCSMLERVATVEQGFTLSVEFDCIGWLIDSVVFLH